MIFIVIIIIIIIVVVVVAVVVDIITTTAITTVITTVTTTAITATAATAATPILLLIIIIIIVVVVIVVITTYCPARPSCRRSCFCPHSCGPPIFPAAAAPRSARSLPDCWAPDAIFCNSVRPHDLLGVFFFNCVDLIRQQC